MFLQKKIGEIFGDINTKVSHKWSELKKCTVSPVTLILQRAVKVPYYRPQRSCGQGNIFTPVCHSVHRGGVCLSACWDTTTPPRSRHPLGAYTPPEQTPSLEQTPPLEQTPLQSRHPPEQTPPWSRHTPQSRHSPRADTPQSRHPPQNQTPPPGLSTPPRSRLRHTVNKRLVRILLECILVHFHISYSSWNRLQINISASILTISYVFLNTTRTRTC